MNSFQGRQFPAGAPAGPSSQHMPNGPTPVLLPNNARIVERGSIRVLCVADVRGDLRSLNDLAKKANADHVIHTGDFGFYDDSSLERIADKTLKHVAQYSPLLPEHLKRAIQNSTPAQAPIKTRLQSEHAQLSELPKFLSKEYTFDVPVYTVWGACEDVRVLEKFRSGEYKVDKLHIIDEASSRLLDIGGVKLRLLGLGGAVVMHKLFDNGEGKTTIAGGQGTMWTTLLQMGELVDTANRVYDPSETRIFITHSSPAREGLLNQLSVTLKADFSISAGLHFRYGSSYNEFSVNPTLDHYRGKLAASKASFNDVWETVKGEVTSTVQQNEAQRTLLQNAIDIVEKMPSGATGPTPFGGPTAAAGKGDVDESAFKNMWNFNLADAAFGMLILDIEGGRIGTEMRAQGFNFAHRGGKSAVNTSASGSANAAASPTVNSSTASAPPAHTPTAAPKAQMQAPYQQQPPAAQSQPVPQPAVPVALPPNQPSPAPKVDSIKPATPLPGASLNGRSGARSTTPSIPKTASASSKQESNTVEPVKKEETQNGISNTGTPEPTEKPSTPAPTAVNANPQQQSSPSSTTKPKESSPGLYLINVNSVEAAREVFPETDRELIESVEEKMSSANRKPYYYVYFKSPDVAKAVLGRLPKEVTEFRPSQRDAPHVKPMNEPREGGKWGDRGRAFKNQRGGRGDFTRSSASESEGPGGARGSDRGDRRGGFGRGDRGDRGERGDRSDRGDKPRGGFESGRGSGRGGRGNKRSGKPDGEGGSGGSSALAAPTAAPATSI